MTINRTELIMERGKVTVLSLPHVRPEAVGSLTRFLEESSATQLFVELDQRRLGWLEDPQSWQSLKLLDVIKRKDTALLFSHLSLRIFQKRLGSYLDMQPGDEMWTSIEVARAKDVEVVLADRDVLVSGLRAWRKTPGFRRPLLALSLTTGSLRKTKEQSAENLDAQLLRTVKKQPWVHAAFLTEREKFIARQVQDRCSGDSIVLVQDVLHEGIVRELHSSHDVALDELNVIPEKSMVARVMPWLVTVLIFTLLIVGFTFGDAETMRRALLTWTIVNGIFTATFTIAAWGHPASVVAAALSAPVVSLNPLVGAGMVGSFVQVLVAPPTISEMEAVGDDLRKLSGWWTNRLARIILIFIAANLGSTIGTFVAFALFPDLFQGQNP